MMPEGQKKAIIVIAIIICAAVIFIISYSLDFLHINFRFFGKTAIENPREDDIKKMTPQSAFDMALGRAREWQPDAQLSFLGANTSSEIGRSDSWRMIFVSEQAKGKGLVVTIENKAVVAVQETLYRGPAADFPANIISSDEAIAQVRATLGYRDVPILGIEAIYGPAEKAWYWGVRTSKGVVTIEAKKH